MTEEQKYLFDLQGYLILEQVVPSEIVDACNRSLDQYEATDESDYPLPLQLGQDRSPENLYISNILEVDPAFRPLIDIPEVIDVIEALNLDYHCGNILKQVSKNTF